MCNGWYAVTELPTRDNRGEYQDLSEMLAVARELHGPMVEVQLGVWPRTLKFTDGTALEISKIPCQCG